MLDQIPFAPYLISAFVGIGLAAATGFRVFMPLFVVSLSSYFGWIATNESFEWLSSLPSLIATGVAMVVEIVAYYVPFVDNILDTINIPLATVAGSVIFASQFVDVGPFMQWALALIAGGGTAAAISSGFAGTRAASTTTTGGIGNSLVATTETAGAGIMSTLAIAVPILAALLAILLVVGFVIVGKKLWNRYKRSRNAEHL